MKLTLGSDYSTRTMPTMTLLKWLIARLGVPISPAPSSRLALDQITPFQQVGHCLWSLALALIGAALAHLFFGSVPRGPENPAAGTQEQGLARRRSWRRPEPIVLAGFVAIMTAGLLGPKRSPGFWSGSTFLLTWGVIGTVALGALCNRGRRRTRWLGAALFGGGYMILIFSPEPYQPTWPHLAVDNVLRDFCPSIPPVEQGYPASSHEIAAANARIRKALDHPVSMHFPRETAFEVVLKSLFGSVRCADGNRIPVYVDPIGLQEAERTNQSPVVIDLDRVPLKTGLGLVTRQLGLAYEVREGLLEISAEGCRDLPYVEDPRLSIGHCLLALLATALGSLIAPLVVDLRSEMAPNETASSSGSR